MLFIVSASSDLHIGDSVRVKASVNQPRFQWGSVTHASVGVVDRLDDDGDIFVEFGFSRPWRGRQDEMEKGVPVQLVIIADFIWSCQSLLLFILMILLSKIF